MITSGQIPSSQTNRSGSREVEVAAATETVRAALSLPFDRSADRKKVLERARRMLAAVLEEEKKFEKTQTRAARAETARADESQPGCGAWWIF